MSTTETKPYIPKDDDVAVQRSGRSWRFAHGKLVRGKEQPLTVKLPDGSEKEIENSGTYPEEKKVVTGLLREIGIVDFHHIKYGRKHRLEADIETADGMITIACGLLATDGTLKVGSSTLSFAWCLLQYEKDELLRLEFAEGAPVKLEGGKDGAKPTYINAFRVDGTNASPIYRPRRDKNAPRVEMNDQWLQDLLPDLQKHSAFNPERHTAADDVGEDGVANTHLAALSQECKDRNWPMPEQMPADWLRFIEGGFKLPARSLSNLSQVTDDQWGNVRQVLTRIHGEGKEPKSLSGAITAFRAKASSAPASTITASEASGFAVDASAEEYNPFEDE